MSLPEISRRCKSCGAAVRVGSRFCPQCGNALEVETAPRASEEHQVETPKEKTAPATTDLTPPTKEFAAFEQAAAVPAPPPAPVAPVPAAFVAAEVEPEAEEAGRAGDLRERVARVREGTKARVGRMREEAIVVLEETPDDSGLRFVLVAVAFFAVFLLILFLSTTLLR